MAEFIDVASQRRSFLADQGVVERLPPEMVDTLKSVDSLGFLDRIAETALTETRLTRRIFVHFEPFFADICARWVSRGEADGVREPAVIAAFARILPFAPYLSTFLRHYLPKQNINDGSRNHNRLAPFSVGQDHGSADNEDEWFTSLLLATLRLINFEPEVYASLTSPSQMEEVLSQSQRHPVERFLAAKILARLLSASDHKLERLVENRIGTGSLVAELDGDQVDYRFLSLHEASQAAEVAELRLQLQQNVMNPPYTQPFLAPLTRYVLCYNGVLLPHLKETTAVQGYHIIKTPTTSRNLSELARLLQADGPILLHGPIGCGKTSLIHEIGRALGKDSSMITLHLNEQTDAKMLIGLYAAMSKPGTFEWQPGVLTKAVEQGQWVLVEDLDRAPSEVISILLPLIERRELSLANRGQTIRAHSDFRLFGTIRTTADMRGEQKLPTLLGLRHWQLLAVQSLQIEEYKSIIGAQFDFLERFIPMILTVYCNLLTAVTRASRSSLDRPLSLRDLLKWCRRLEHTLSAADVRSHNEAIDQTTHERMLLDAMDCFAGHSREPYLRQALGVQIGRDMHLSPERVNHLLSAYEPSMTDSQRKFNIGRVSLPKKQAIHGMSSPKRPFAPTSQAKKLLEQLAVAVTLQEPVLLVGETGIGKTAVVQSLAQALGHKLMPLNLSQQSEVSDLLGGFKPVNIRSITMPLKEEFEDLFTLTRISVDRNQKYLDKIAKRIEKGRWREVSKLWRQAPGMFEQILQAVRDRPYANIHHDGQTNGSAKIPPLKRRKTEQNKLAWLLALKPRWDAFGAALDQLDIQLAGDETTPFAFAFVEGPLVKAVRQGDWVLLDEINLASADTLESIADLFQSEASSKPFILLSETGSVQKMEAHPEFRIFAAMNPATDVGKRDLPPGIRSRFTELYVSSPDNDLKALQLLCASYLKGKSVLTEQLAGNVSRVYMEIKALADGKGLVDGANEVPHYSLRTLTRALTYANDMRPLYGLDRALYEGFCMCFLTVLNQESERAVRPVINKYLLRDRAMLKKPLKQFDQDGRYVRFMNQEATQQYLVQSGSQPIVDRPDYVVTPYVERNLLNLVRATSTRRFPVLIQGPTSSGKTSMIEFLADFSGNKFVRINNHEHTDLQEYLGTYVSGADGKLSFQDGLLVQAMRNGYWIVLDELNLAPTDVLEALNRLLDDNRELLVPETQEIVRPHENFMLFATQNPPGLYGGRNVLSRAFRNRFLEIHFDDIPSDELETILQQRARHTAPSDCKRIVTVYKELSRLRQSSRVFDQKHSFATLRDLFRWALRGADSREDLATNGFMLLAERVRNEEERSAVKGIIETVFKVKIDPDMMYEDTRSPHLRRFMNRPNMQGVVWTSVMRRVYVLVASALENHEPVLLVGETGGGKTTVCQLLAEALGKTLHIVNAHQNTETGDLIGSQRPIRNRGAIMGELQQSLQSALKAIGKPCDGNLGDLLQTWHTLREVDRSQVPAEVLKEICDMETRSKALFEWADGSLVQAMKRGQLFLLDEISLADDSVLERLNSVLEPSRSLLLAEKGVDDSFVRAEPGFEFLATMNPGGDFGKKELSPALRNRFTEIWVPPLSGADDILQIVRVKLAAQFIGAAEVIVEFASWFGRQFRSSSATAFSVRDILVWVDFVNKWAHQSPEFALVHGAATVFIDTLGANPSARVFLDPREMQSGRQSCLDKLGQLIGHSVDAVYWSNPDVTLGEMGLQLGPFSIPRNIGVSSDVGEAFLAPTTRLNGMRVARALGLQRPILLEGNPGVGKTTLVSILGKLCGVPLTRINLSDQTDLMDLFGSDVPVEGAEAGNFAWRDAPFLRAMQNGEWVLLDEMNLASQSVLEGLNACLDHRGEVYIAELDQTFTRHPDFRLFAAQNPYHQGGGRKGLPSSFVNRFIVVYADVFSEEDLRTIASARHGTVDEDTITRMISFISVLDREVSLNRSLGSQGSPWEFNLRDTLRWLDMLTAKSPFLNASEVADFLDVVVRQRFRTQTDREAVKTLFLRSFARGTDVDNRSVYYNISATWAQVGLALRQRNLTLQSSLLPTLNIVPRLRETESVMIAVNQNLPCILVGHSGTGKSVLLQDVAAACGKKLVVFPMNADVDAMDLVGGFEQSDPERDLHQCLEEVRDALRLHILQRLPDQSPGPELELFTLLNSGQALARTDILQAMAKLTVTPLPTTSFGATIARALEILQRPRFSGTPRFEWLDSVIVKTIQKGEWLVLDNANLCSSSVLDRLNSLLERPDGHLSINEHSGPGGEPRIIVPHPDFRIFLTMDPRHGELSRAMRNRSIEIYLENVEWHPELYDGRILPIEPSLQRLHDVRCILGDLRRSQEAMYNEMVPMALGTLTLRDASILSSSLGASAEVTHKDVGILDMPQPDIHRFLLVTNLLKEEIAAMYGSTIDAIKDDFDGVVDSTETDPSHHLSTLRHDQPLYLLANADLIKVTRVLGREDVAAWLATRYELLWDVQLAFDSVETHVAGVADFRSISTLTRLQRSFASEGNSALIRDSTAGAYKYLTSMAKHVRAFLVDTRDGAPRMQLSIRRIFLRQLLVFWNRTAHLLRSSQFNNSLFQINVSQGTKLLGAGYDDGNEAIIDREQSTDNLRAELARLLAAAFGPAFRLATGLYMEKLWLVLRPAVIPDAATLQLLARLEDLGNRFDQVKWEIADRSVEDLYKAQSALCSAYLVAQRGLQVESLVPELEEEVSRLEFVSERDSTGAVPHFACEFEGFRQLFALDTARKGLKGAQLEDSNTMVLSNLPTVLRMRLHHDGQELKSPFQLIASIMASDSSSRPWDGELVACVLRKIGSSGTISLRSFDHLETELASLRYLSATAAAALAQDPQQMLSELLQTVLAAIWKALGLDMDDGQEMAASASAGVQAGLIPQQKAQSASSEGVFDLRYVMQEHLRHVVNSAGSLENNLPENSSTLALAWTHFALGCLKLYVPDKAFDPYLHAKLDRDFAEEVRRVTSDKLSASSQLDELVTGKGSVSLRTQMLQSELSQLPPLPEAGTVVYRPAKSQLQQVQGDFTNVLRTVIQGDVVGIVENALSNRADRLALAQLDSVASNIERLVERLWNGHPAYRDLTLPVVGFLRCLQIGLSLAHSSSHKGAAHVSQTLNSAPFMGADLASLESTQLSPGSFESLALLRTYSSVHSAGQKWPLHLRRMLTQSMHKLHDAWAEQLEKDKTDEASRQSLYRFRGSLEDEEEFDEDEFQEMFPVYDAEVEEIGDKPVRQSVRVNAVRDMSVKVAGWHARIFLAPRDAQAAITEQIEMMGQLLAGDVVKSSAQVHNAARTNTTLYPALLLALDGKTQALSSALVPATYNFYTESNLPEARKVVNLVGQVRKRFKSLQVVDEIGHLQPVADVIAACDKVLQVPYAEPLSKLITTTEQLHACLYEWETGGWASRTYGAPALYTQLTDTLVSWRQLELSTWAKLFEMEVDKCKEDAYSWWFVAYGVAIVEPLRRLQQGEEDLTAYAVELVASLQTYLSDAMLGQYSTRMQMLRQLTEHLTLLTVDFPGIMVVRNALANFITLFAMFEESIDGEIQRDRKPIEKAMKKVLLLASWKDTNITALRQSARKSHQKLFRLVRKFRAVLAQPVRAVLDRGLPESSKTGTTEQHSDSTAEVVNISQDAIVTCEVAFSGWLQDPQSERLSDARNVLAIMGRLASIPEETVVPEEVLSDFVTERRASIAALRKETPPFVTEENKDVVKHLTSRKKKLFAETLQGVRQMGFSRNLGQVTLGKQGSLAALLVSSGQVSVGGKLSSLADADGAWSQVVDLSTRVRHAVNNHSTEISRHDINRSLGCLEGILSVTFQQRKSLAKATNDFHALNGTISKLQALAAEDVKDQLMVEEQRRNYSLTLHWLVEILQYAIKLVDLQFAATKNGFGEMQQDDPRITLGGWLQRTRELSAEESDLADLPDGVTTLSGITLHRRIDTMLAEMHNDIDRLMQEHPELIVVLTQVKLWTTGPAGVDTSAVRPELNSLTALRDAVLTISGLILDAVQKYNRELKTLPTSTEDASWLVNHANGLQKAVRVLGQNTVEDAISDVTNSVKSLDLNDLTIRSHTWALLAVVVPFAQQYRTVAASAISSLANLHLATCRFSCFLGKSFIQLATHGYCTPREKSDDKSQEAGKMEADGTGLGQGEGAEDISKDIQPDEDLSELAQQQQQAADEQDDREQDGIEDQADAVDMDGEEMEGGELGSLGGESGDEDGEGREGDDQDGRDDMDDEAGDVDELDPTAVDEKIWSGKDEEAKKEKEGQQSKAQKAEGEDELGAAAGEGQEEPQAGGDVDGKQTEKAPDGEEADEEVAGPEEEEENLRQNDGQVQDPRAEEKDALELPDDMQLDADEKGSDLADDDDNLDDLSDADGDEDEVEGPPKREEQAPDDGDENQKPAGIEKTKEEDDEGISTGPDDNEAVDDTVSGDEAEDPMELQEDEYQMQDEGPEQKQDDRANDDGKTNPDDAVPSDERGGNGAQNELDVDRVDNDDKVQSQAVSRQPNGETGQTDGQDQDGSGGQDGALSQVIPADQDAQPPSSGEEASEINQSLRKLGDAWDRWYRNNRDILDAPRDEQNQPTQQQSKPSDADLAKVEFQHLQDDNAEADAQQALGAATDEEVKPMDDTMATDDEMEAADNVLRLLPDEMDLDDEDQEFEGPGPAAEQDPESSPEQEQDPANGRKGVATMQGGQAREQDDLASETDEITDQDHQQADDKEDVDDVEETSTQLSTTHVNAPSATVRPYSESLQMWTSYQTRTHALSLSLTSQLRLILTPSQSTKLSGAHRTGKRLNIKKIIPFIASGYRRDKIWLRRSVPTKRAYQILLCVDDSKSMGERAAGSLALESLVMVSRALAMLEAGSIGVVGFGDRVFAAHDLMADSAGSSAFGTSPDAGARTLQHFTFGADRTDVLQLVRDIIERFRAARLRQTQSAASLWQLALILSDGLTPSSEHESIRRLLREAAEERVMCVFIILDDGTHSKKGESVLELKEAKFVNDVDAPGGSRVLVERYLDSFPFPYYLIVHQLDDLPSALAGVLRTWFSEVNA
jgi:midasin